MKELESFLLLDFPSHLRNLATNATRQFGTMTAVQMLDHLRKAFVLSHCGLKMEITTPLENIPKMQAFLVSDKQFRPGSPRPEAYNNLQDLDLDLEAAKIMLLKAMADMFCFYRANPNFKQVHPSFGLLDFEMWLHLHRKHIKHHLRQFSFDL